MSSSSTKNSHLQIPCCGATAAPPPTPSTQSNPFSSSSSSAAAADVLSHLLHRLPPSLTSIPSRRRLNSSSSAAADDAVAVSPQIISLKQTNTNINSDLLLASRETGFFQLTAGDHSIPSKLAESAEIECLSLFELPIDQKHHRFPSNWPTGFDFDEEDGFNPDTLCLDSTESDEPGLNSVREFIHEMERVGLEVIESLSKSLGFVNPARKDPTRICSLLWVSETEMTTCKEPGRMYPYIVGLQYQIRSQKYSLQSGSGLVSVLPQIDSVLVSLGDIAKVWSNGQIKNVRGRPIPIIEDKEEQKPRCITMSLLISLSLDSIVSPLLSLGEMETIEEEEQQDDDEKKKKKEGDEVSIKFSSFYFEDYAWRIYHERLSTKDPLDRYLI
ncbi:uncharacterized protein LOC124910374 [Impatiens glandulifera]|uniref:uncharacterized protein LOC124910374 n=1 Tax=Impatiens glandulifera TaxID=253017 RepID=UPI001FB1466B|nr:uncharacterized protein LOC124910374 [Impatiens glandulifera]